MSARPRLPTTAERSRLMARVRQANTAPELAVRKLLHALGARFRTGATDLPGSPDVVNRSGRWAIFVHGCFWHAHQGCRRWKLPKHNRAFWSDKFARNRARDRRKLLQLERSGYAALVVWQCELDDLDGLKAKLATFLRGQRLRTGKRTMNPPGDAGGTSDARGNGRASREAFARTTTGRSVTRSVSHNGGNAFTTRQILGEEDDGESPAAAFDAAFLRRTTPRRHKPEWPEARCVDLFCGCGGLSLGAREACLAVGLRFTPVLALDCNPLCVNVYRRNFHPRRALTGDIASVLGGRFGNHATTEERDLLKKVGKVDVLLAGPPCQGNSDLNNHTRRDDDRNKLYERVARFVELAKPTHVLIENIPTAIHGVEKAVQRTRERIEKLGYDVDAGVIDLRLLGVPQRRRRHVLVASATRTIRLADIVDSAGVASPRSIEWAIRDIGDEQANGIFTSPSQHSPTNVARMQYLLDEGLYDLPNDLRPPCHRNGHTYKSMYGRLRWDEPAQTITSGFTSPGQGRFVHPAKPRALTPHEAARLQFFPDFFDFSAATSRRGLAAMIGNAVPMKLSYVFCLEFLA